jgi:dTMP kinase
VNGRLISIEGVDGCGKSTLAANLAKKLINASQRVVLTREPGDSSIGTEIRQMVNHHKEAICAKAEFLLYAADRAQHVNQLVLPALQDGKIVISDRMSDSSMVYQGYGRGLSLSMIETVNRWAMGDLRIDLTIYLRLDVTVALERIKKTRDQITRFEQEKMEYWNRVVDGFEKIYASRDDVLILDATQSQESLADQAFCRVNKII